jgi:hypothetical protein
MKRRPTGVEIKLWLLAALVGGILLAGLSGGLKPLL